MSTAPESANSMKPSDPYEGMGKLIVGIVAAAGAGMAGIVLVVKSFNIGEGKNGTGFQDCVIEQVTNTPGWQGQEAAVLTDIAADGCAYLIPDSGRSAVEDAASTIVGYMLGNYGATPMPEDD